MMFSTFKLMSKNLNQKLVKLKKNIFCLNPKINPLFKLLTENFPRFDAYPAEVSNALFHAYNFKHNVFLTKVVKIATKFYRLCGKHCLLLLVIDL